ncbi:ASCH/PUA domain-containing protein [Tellurirhabdus bombi]|uniref:ASCH/PUA domain-containing protein n=1 Tax=Tellurirhabdus bombi TaxID=2907205 RepID=UPI001F29ABD3|nr:ASCH/PUA domain-containing protein [Tellurirhabdus bombi]
MPKKTHLLKTLPKYFDEIALGWKPFEVRKNDRNFQLGDYLILAKWNPDQNQYEDDEWLIKEVCYLLPGGQFGIEEGYCVLGLSGTFSSLSFNEQKEMYETLMSQ